MSNFKKPYKITCEEAQLLMVPMWAKDTSVTEEEKNAFESHITMCQACKSEYEETCRLMPIVKEYWGPISEDTLELIEKAGQSYKPKMTVEEGWKDLCRRCPDLAENTEKPKSLQLFLRIGAAAACLVIGVFTWFVFSNYSKPHILHQSSSSLQVASAPKPSVKVELVRPSGNIAVETDQAIVADNELKTLLINGKHQMVMNLGTSLSIKPVLANAQLGCSVELTAGEIYTHVQHDGNPFIVDTVHGKAVITGTTFDIKVTDDSTTLVVSEGTVQFESENGTVKVAAGQTSEIVGQSAPTRPVLCNVAEHTAWATGYKPGPALTQAKSNTDPWELPTSLRRKPIVLDETDYGRWVEWERDWFKQEFPWIFQLKDAFAEEGIEVDYPQLMIQSGDVWQFVCLDVAPARFSVIDPSLLLNTASDYGFDELWLLENVSATKDALEKPVLSANSFTGLKAFERWLEYLDETKGLEPPTPIYSYRAGKYLANTRSLIWFAVRDGKYDLTDKERAEVLVLLQKEVTAACNCQNDELYPKDEQKPLCDEEICQKPVDHIVGHIKTMKAIEERIAEYEIGK